MTHEAEPKSLAGWLALPQIDCPTIASTAEKGTVYTVHKVGFLSLGLDVPRIPGMAIKSGHYFLPTAELDFAGEKQLCRLPPQLADWAFVTQALPTLFPTQVEFGVLDGRHYAEWI